MAKPAIVLVHGLWGNGAHWSKVILELAKEQLMDHEYIPVGPLMPLRALMGGGPAQQ